MGDIPQDVKLQLTARALGPFGDRQSEAAARLIERFRRNRFLHGRLHLGLCGQSCLVDHVPARQHALEQQHATIGAVLRYGRERFPQALGRYVRRDFPAANRVARSIRDGAPSATATLANGAGSSSIVTFSFRAVART